MLSGISNSKARLYLSLASVLLYLPTLWFGFSPMDDKWILIDNLKFMSDIHNLPALFTSSAMGMYYRPIWTSSLMIDQVIGQGSPLMFHLSNILLHALCCMLVFKLFLLFETSKPTAFYFALLFALHPINVQTVAWIPGRNDSLLCLFSLLAIIYLIHYLIDPKPRFLIIQLASFCLALVTKENAIVLPLLFTTLLYYFKGKQKKLAGLQNKQTVTALVLLWIVLSLGWFFWRKNIVNVFPSFASGTLTDTLLNFFSALIVYIGKCAVPVQQAIVPTIAGTSLIPPFVIVLLIAFLLIKFSVKNKGLATLGIIWFLLFILLPAWVGSSNGIGEQYEHRIYTSLVGFLLFISQLDFQRHGPVLIRKKLMLVLFIALPLAFAAKTAYRCRVYANEFIFAQTAAEETPQVALLQNIEGLQFRTTKNYDRAIECFSKAITLNGNKGEYYNNRGGCYLILKNYPLAIEDYNKTIQLLSTNGDAYLNLSMAHYLSGNKDLAKNYLRKAMKYRARGINQNYVDAFK